MSDEYNCCVTLMDESNSHPSFSNTAYTMRSMAPARNNNNLATRNCGYVDCTKDAPINECRICHEEDNIANLESPCGCSGSVKYVHRKCVQRWCDEKGDTKCEICLQPYQSGYTTKISPVALLQNDVAVDLSHEWSSQAVETQEPRIVAMVAAQRRFLDAQYEEANSHTAACWRSAALMLMAVLLLRHTIALASANPNEDAPSFYILFVLRIAGFLLPVYIMMCAIKMVQRRHERQETAVAAAGVAIFLEARESREVHVSIGSGGRIDGR